MSKIVVEGHSIETKEIFDIILVLESRQCGVLIKMIDKPSIYISRVISYETYTSEFSGIYAPYKLLYESVKKQWETDKTELKVFKS